MDLFDFLGGARAGNRGMSPLEMAVIGVLSYDALKARGQLADMFGTRGRSVLATGLRQLLDRCRKNGQEHRVQSWVSIGPNKPIAPHELALALGEKQIAWLVQESAIPRDELMAGLCAALPELVDQLTPDGREPTEGENRWK